MKRTQLSILTIIVLISSILLSCKGREREQTTIIPNKTVEGYTLVTIDGCEYIETGIAGYATGSVLTHKGNCKNTWHDLHHR